MVSLESLSLESLVWSIWPDNNFPPNAGAPVTSLGLGQPTAPRSPLVDSREHPSWRIEMLQRVLNLTTVRTHQYAVWITVGFFGVKAPRGLRDDRLGQSAVGVRHPWA